MTETTDHDTVTKLSVQMDHVVQQQAEGARQLGRVEGKLDSQGTTLTGLETRTQTLEQRPQPVLAGADAQKLIDEHREMYGFFSSFKGYIYPLILSGPLSAIISALLTTLIIHATK